MMTEKLMLIQSVKFTQISQFQVHSFVCMGVYLVDMAGNIPFLTWELIRSADPQA